MSTNHYKQYIDNTLRSIQALTSVGFSEAIRLEQVARLHFEELTLDERERSETELVLKMKVQNMFVATHLMDQKRLIRPRIR